MVKYCPKCGSEQKDHAKFCSKCGATFNVQSNVSNSDIKTNIISNNVPNSSNTEDNKSKNTLIIGITAVILITIICLTCIFIFTGTGSDDSSSVSTDTASDSVSESSSSVDSSSMTTHDFDEFSLTVPNSWSVTKNNERESNGCIATVDTNGENVGLIFRFDGDASNFNEATARSYFSQYVYSYCNPITIGSHSGYISDDHPAGSSVNQEAFIFVDHGRIYEIVMNRNFGDITNQLVKGFVAH